MGMKIAFALWIHSMYKYIVHTNINSISGYSIIGKWKLAAKLRDKSSSAISVLTIWYFIYFFFFLTSHYSFHLLFLFLLLKWFSTAFPRLCAYKVKTWRSQEEKFMWIKIMKILCIGIFYVGIWMNINVHGYWRKRGGGILIGHYWIV